MEPKLKPLHAASALSKAKLATLRKLPTAEIVGSLKPGQPGALKVRADGTVLDGHHRLAILVERGVGTDDLPREVIAKEPET